MGWRCARHRLDPMCHMGLVGEAGIGGDGAERIAGAGDTKPCVASAKFGPEYFRRDSVRLSEAARHGFRRQAIRFGPGRQFQRCVMSQIGSEEIGPVIFAVRCDDLPLADFFPEQRCGQCYILFGGASDRFHIVDAI